MSKYLKRKTYWRNKCDKAFGEIVKLRDGYCQETNTKDNLQCAHIIGRNYYSTRWDLENAIALNFRRHKYYTHHPVEWRRFINEKFGKGYYEKLEERALNYRKRSLPSYMELYDELETLLASLKERRGKIQINSNPGRSD